MHLAAVNYILVLQAGESLSFGLFGLDFTSVHLTSVAWIHLGIAACTCWPCECRKAREALYVPFYTLLCRLTKQKGCK